MLEFLITSAFLIIFIMYVSAANIVKIIVNDIAAEQKEKTNIRKSFLIILTFLFIAILLVTTTTMVKVIVEDIATLDNDGDDIIHFTPATTVIFILILVTPCYIAELIVYKEIRYFVARKNKKRLSIFLRLISLIFATVVLFIYFEGFLWVWNIRFRILSEMFYKIPFEFTKYGLLIGIPANLILPFAIKSVEGNTSDKLQSGNNVGNNQ